MYQSGFTVNSSPTFGGWVVCSQATLLVELEGNDVSEAGEVDLGHLERIDGGR
jgi:hypothetical protein